MTLGQSQVLFWKYLIYNKRSFWYHEMQKGVEAMGSWFSNMHIRVNDTAGPEAVEAYLRQVLTQQGYLCAASAEEADGAAAVIGGEHWVTVCSDLMELEGPDAVAALGGPLSEHLQTDVLGIGCFDSDYLYLNLIDQREKVNAWLGIGSAAGLGIKRRTGLAAWKKKVRDFEAFSACAREKYVCAEEFLFAAADCLDLEPEQGSASYEYLRDLGLDKKARVLYFKLPEGAEPKELPRLEQMMSSAMPSFIGKPQCVSAINRGGESRGLSVYFLGSYVEREELTFTDTCFVTDKGTEPFSLTKVQLTDGQWAYYYNDPGFRLPPKVDERLPFGKQMRMMMDQDITVRFVPQGDPRKILDITVILQPDKNPEGQTGWNVWHGWGSKEAYIDHFNGSWAQHRSFAPPEALPPVLRREDFD